LEISVVATFGIAIDGRLLGGLVFGSDAGAVVEPGFVVQIPAKQVSAPDKSSIVMAINEAVVPTVSAGNAQEQFVSRPAVSDDGITELDHPVVRQISVGERDPVRMICPGNDRKGITLFWRSKIGSDLVKANELGSIRASSLTANILFIVPDLNLELGCTATRAESTSVDFQGTEFFFAKNAAVVSISIFRAAVKTDVVREAEKVRKLI